MGAQIVDHRYVSARGIKIGDYAMVTLSGRPVLLQRAQQHGDILSGEMKEINFVNPQTGAILQVTADAKVELVHVAIHIQGGA